jgi:hypothetical protein
VLALLRVRDGDSATLVAGARRVGLLVVVACVGLTEADAVGLAFASAPALIFFY